MNIKKDRPARNLAERPYRDEDSKTIPQTESKFKNKELRTEDYPYTKNACLK